MFFIPVGDPTLLSFHSPLLLLYTPIPFPHDTPANSLNGNTLIMMADPYPHPLHPCAHTHTHSLTHFNTHPLGAQKASLV